MQRFEKLMALAAPLDEKNIDTDQLVPARFLMKSRADGYAQYLFYDRRFDAEGDEKADFILNQAPFRTAKIIVSDANFGSGSSREHAVWALMEYGIRAVIAPSFGPIFLRQ
ncbi:MAG: 3-isopropylmalate dehydratase small subunit [Alphaproteobacteria bacterium MarineAlpha10_Bin2]|nr:MAG: 3-isopropylmalate dehydratase small subunit [Alphaproteobacteria bacterium MarineAlpha10_Bin2]